MNLWRSTKTDGGVEMHKKMGTAMGAPEYSAESLMLTKNLIYQ